MNTTKTVIVISVTAAILFLAITAGWAISTSNKEVSLRTAIENKMVANQADFDNMKKVISATAAVSDREVEALREIITGYAQVRGPNGVGSGPISVTAVKEAVPSVTSIRTLEALANAVEAQRNSWTFRQKELVDLKREHDTLLRQFPSNALLSILGRKEIGIIVVTSADTQQAFTTGQDDDSNPFRK